MDRRWAPAGAAAAVVVLVAAVALVLTGDDGPSRVATLPAPSAQASLAPEETAQASRAPEDTAEPTQATGPAAPSAATASSPAAAGADPDTPVSSDDTPTSAPGAPAPAPSRTRTAQPEPPPAPKPTGPTSAEPKPSAAPSKAARSAFAFDAAYGTDEPKEVVVQYGDSSSCPHANVTHAVRESADRVVVTLEADAQDPDRACTADYRQMLVPVRLQQPLGERVLVDGSRGEQVPVDRSCDRPFSNPPPPKDCRP